MRSMRTDSARSASARSFCRLTIWLTLTPGAGWSSNTVMTGPGLMPSIVPSTPNSRAALRIVLAETDQLGLVERVRLLLLVEQVHRRQRRALLDRLLGDERHRLLRRLRLGRLGHLAAQQRGGGLRLDAADPEVAAALLLLHPHRLDAHVQVLLHQAPPRALLVAVLGLARAAQHQALPQLAQLAAPALEQLAEARLQDERRADDHGAEDEEQRADESEARLESAGDEVAGDAAAAQRGAAPGHLAGDQVEQRRQRGHHHQHAEAAAHHFVGAARTQSAKRRDRAQERQQERRETEKAEAQSAERLAPNGPIQL